MHIMIMGKTQQITLPNMTVEFVQYFSLLPVIPSSSGCVPQSDQECGGEQSKHEHLRLHSARILPLLYTTSEYSINRWQSWGLCRDIYRLAGDSGDTGQINEGMPGTLV